METISASLALCGGKPLVDGGFPSKRVSNADFYVFLGHQKWYIDGTETQEAMNFAHTWRRALDTLYREHTFKYNGLNLILIQLPILP